MPRVHQLTVLGANVIVIVEDELTLVDTGFRGSSRRVVRFIRSLGRLEKEIGLIVITHNHFDHVGGLTELRRLTKAKVAVHVADIGDFEGEPAYPGGVRRLLRVPPFSALHSVFSISASEVDIELKGGEVLDALDGLEVIHTPGHTPGSISLFSPRNKLLIVGDALDKHGKAILPPHEIASTDLTQAIESVKKIAQLDFEVLCFGHGHPFTENVPAKIRDLTERINN